MSINNYLKSIISVGLVSLILGAVMLYDDNKSPNKKIQDGHNRTVSKEGSGTDNLKSNLVNEFVNKNNTNEERVAELRSKAKDMYRSTFKQGHMKKIRQYNYEDEWCVASEDLKENDFYYFQDEIKSWLFSRGHVTPQNKGETQYFSLNSEFIKPYQELDVETLIQHSRNDDQMALITLVGRPGVDANTKLKAARRLVILGDTSTGLERLIMNELNQSGYQKENVEKSKHHLTNALAYVEYGLMRYDTSGLETYLMYASDKDTFLNGLDPAELINSNDYDGISRKARNLVDKINEQRLSRTLSELDMDNVPKAARMYYQHMLANHAYGQYESLMNENWIPTTWKQDYLIKTPCVLRMIARNKFLNEQLAEINKEISKLQGE